MAARRVAHGDQAPVAVAVAGTVTGSETGSETGVAGRRRGGPVGSVHCAAVAVPATLALALTYRGLVQRLAVEPPGFGFGLWRSPDLVRVPAPSLARVGDLPFHLGMGLGAASLGWTVLWLFGVSRAPVPTRLVCFLVWLPAVWAWGDLMAQAGPRAESAAAGLELLSANAPVFILGLGLSLALDARGRAAPRLQI